MASIIQNTKQLEACNKVNELINEVKRIDELLDTKHPLKIDGGKKNVIEIQAGLGVSFCVSSENCSARGCGASATGGSKGMM